MSKAKVELGAFCFTTRSSPGTRPKAAGAAIKQELAFTDGLAQAEGSTGEIHPAAR